MPKVPFTQYLMPHGDIRHVTTEVSEAVAERANMLLDAGYRFECECLSIGNLVSLTIVGPSPALDGEDDDLAGELVENGPAVPAAVERLIMSFECDDLSHANQEAP